MWAIRARTSGMFRGMEKVGAPRRRLVPSDSRWRREAFDKTTAQHHSLIGNSAKERRHPTPIPTSEPTSRRLLHRARAVRSWIGARAGCERRTSSFARGQLRDRLSAAHPSMTAHEQNPSRQRACSPAPCAPRDGHLALALRRLCTCTPWESVRAYLRIANPDCHSLNIVGGRAATHSKSAALKLECSV